MSEGQQLCQLKHELGVALHNMGNQYKKAAGVLTGLLEDDPEDHVVRALRSIVHCICLSAYLQPESCAESAPESSPLLFR